MFIQALVFYLFVFFFSSRRRHTRCALVTGVQTCALPIYPGISIKLSALHPRYEYLQAARVRDELIPNVIELAQAARAVNIPLMIDAEESDRLEPHMDVFAALIDAGIADGWTGLGIVIQAYQKRAPAVIDWLVHRARARGVRLEMGVGKGATWGSGRTTAQTPGL